MSLDKVISIVIVSYNVRDFLAKCLESIHQTSLRNNLEVIVVDNASIDGSCQMVKSQFPWVKLIENAENIGFGAANNLGILKATGLYTLILNPDTIVTEETLSKCIQVLESDAGIGAVGVRMIDGSGNYLPESRRGLPGLWRSFTKMTGLYKLFPTTMLWNGYYLGSLEGNQSGAIEVLTGAFMFVRSNLLKQLGGFDDRFFMYGEDIDLSKRILDAGFKIHFLADESIIHFKGESTRKTAFAYNRRFYQSMVIYADKHLKKEAPLFITFLKVLIAILGLFSWIRYGLSALFQTIVALGAIYGIYVVAHHTWAVYHFNNNAYFETLNVQLTSLLCSIIIVFSTWFYGWFEKFSKTKYLNAGMMTALIAILLIFSLLPVHLRNSRAVLFIGWIFSYPILFFLKKVWALSSGGDMNRVVLVTDFEHSNRIIPLIDNARKTTFLGLIAPSAKQDMSPYLNSISHLTEVVHNLRVDEVIFDATAMKMKDILSHMALPTTEVTYKIAGYDAIIGSKTSTNTGEIYRAESGYRLARPFYRRLKRCFDMLFSMVLLLMWPLLKSRYGQQFTARDLWSVFVGSKSFVSYGQDLSRASLPPIKAGILGTEALIGRVIEGNFVDTIENADICYVKNYQPRLDFLILYHRLKIK